jgi:hypothetical protein
MVDFRSCIASPLTAHGLFRRVQERATSWSSAVVAVVDLTEVLVAAAVKCVRDRRSPLARASTLISVLVELVAHGEPTGGIHRGGRVAVQIRP